MSSTWKVDRHVPVALIISLALFFIAQTAAGSWWASSISSRVESLEQARTATAVTAGPQSERLVRVETNIQNLIDSVKEIKDILRARPRSGD